MTEDADADQLWRCCLSPGGPAGVRRATWQSFNPTAMIDGLRTLLHTRARNPDQPRAQVRVVFDSAAIAAAIEGNNLDRLVHGGGRLVDRLGLWRWRSDTDAS